MIEFDQAPDHVVSHVNVQQRMVSCLSPNNCGQGKFSNIKEEPNLILESPLANKLGQGPHERVPCQATQSPPSPAMADNRSRFVCLTKVTFPMKLWELLEEGNTNLVQWTENGLAIVLDPCDFDKEIQVFFPGEFGDHKLRNFCRQLRVYDFNEVTIRDPNWPTFSHILHEGSTIRIFYHHYFRRGCPEDLLQIVRVRDIVPRGRSRPKHPKPKQVFPAPTGPYELGETPPKIKHICYEPSPKKRNISGSFCVNQVEAHGPDYGNNIPLAVASILQHAGEGIVSKSPYLEKVASCGGDTEHQQGGITLTEKVVLQQEVISDSHIQVSHTVDVVPSQVPNPGRQNTCDAVSMTDESSEQDFSDSESGCSRNSREHKQTIQSKVKMEDNNIASPAKASSSQGVSGAFSVAPTSSIVLVPCLQTAGQLLPLSTGAGLSEMGYALLRSSPQLQAVLRQLKPDTSDKAVQWESHTSVTQPNVDVLPTDNNTSQ